MSKNKSMYNKGDSLLLDESLRNTNFGRLHSLFTNLSLNRFVWEGLPNTVESRHIERALHTHGQCFIFDDEELGIICLPCQTSDILNVYGEPTSVVVTGHGFSKLKKISDGVRIINNDSLSPSALNVIYYSNAISEVDKTINKNLKKIKVPYIIATTKANELTYRNIIKKIDTDEDEIFVDERLTNGGQLGIEVLNTNTPYLIDNLQQHKNDLVNEFLTIMGLNNSNANNGKKERLLVDEVNVNNGEILMYLDTDYKNRAKACEEIKTKFGFDIEVKKKIDELSQNFRGEEKDGELHDGYSDDTKE